MQKMLKKHMAIFMMFLVVGIPVYSASVFAAGNINYVRVRGASAETESSQRTSNVLAKDDWVYVKTEAFVTPGPINENYLDFKVGNSIYEYGTGACTPSTDPYRICEKFFRYGDQPWTPGRYAGYVQLYNSTEKTTTLGSPVNFFFYVDGLPPVVQFSTVPPIYSIANGKLNIFFTAHDEAYSGATGSKCAGIDQIIVTVNKPGIDPESLGEKNFGLSFANCETIPVRNSTFTVPLEPDGIYSKIGNDYVGLVQFCIYGIDKVGQEPEPVCAEVNVDFLRPAFPDDASIMDENGNRLDNNNEIGSGQKLTVKANVSEANLHSVRLNASFYSLLPADQSLVPKIVSNIDGVVGKHELTWEFYVGTGDRFSANPSNLVATAIDKSGNVARDILIDKTKLPKDIDDTKPYVYSIYTDHGKFLRISDNKITAKIFELQSGISPNNVFLSSNGMSPLEADSCSVVGPYNECVWPGHDISSSDSEILYRVFGRDNAYNDMNESPETPCKRTPFNCTLIFDDEPPAIGNILIENEDVLRVDSPLVMTADIRDGISGIETTSAILQAWANNSDCGFGSTANGGGEKATSCTVDADDANLYHCSWPQGSVVNANCFNQSKPIMIKVLDKAGNEGRGEKFLLPTIAPFIKNINLSIGTWGNKNGWISSNAMILVAEIEADGLSMDSVTAQSNSLSVPDSHPATCAYVSNNNYRCIWNGLRATTSIDGGTGNVMVTAEDTVTGQVADRTEQFPIDLTAPAVVEKMIIRTAESIDRELPYRDEPVYVVAKVREPYSGIDYANTFLYQKHLDRETVSATKRLSLQEVLVECNQDECGCHQDPDNAALLECVWRYQNYDPEIYGRNPITKLNVTWADKAHNNASTPENLKADIKVLEIASSGINDYWNVEIIKNRVRKSINRNIWKISNDLKIYVPMEFKRNDRTGSPAIQEVKVDAGTCKVNYPGSNPVIYDNAQYYIDKEKYQRKQKFIYLALPDPPKPWLEDDSNAEVKINCTVKNWNRVGNQFFADPEINYLIFSIPLTDSVHNSLGAKQLEKVYTNENLLHILQDVFIGPSEYVVNFAPDACVGLGYAVSGLSTVAGIAYGICSIPPLSCQSAIWKMWQTMWGWWKRNSFFDIISGEFLCQTVVCGSFDNTLLGDAALNWINDDWRELALSMPSDISDNFLLSLVRWPPCFTGVYKGAVEYESAIKMQNFCEANKIYTGANIECGGLISSWWCRQTTGLLAEIGTTILASLLLDKLMSVFKDEIFDKVMNTAACDPPEAVGEGETAAQDAAAKSALDAAQELIPGLGIATAYYCFGQGVASGLSYANGAQYAKQVIEDTKNMREGVTKDIEDKGKEVEEERIDLGI